MFINYDELFSLENDEKRVQSLGGPAKFTNGHRYFIELTLNHPRSKLFLSCTSDLQKKMYLKLWHYMIKPYKLTMSNYESDYVFESCKSGQLHLHGYVSFDVCDMNLPLVLISDIVKRYLNRMTKRYSEFKEANMFHEWKRYRCPSIVCQLRYSEDDNYEERCSKWKLYMQKTQVLK